MIRLTKEQIQEKKKFIKNYIQSENAASGSSMDSNANVSTKNIATLEAEINKDINIQVNRSIVYDKIEELFGKDISEKYIEQLESHLIYCHDETSLKPYCVSATMYPLLTDGLTKLGGESKAPQHLASFCGTFVNFVFAISSQFAGAVATVEFLMYFDYFARKEYGDDYLVTHAAETENHLQHVVYAINQPAAARGYQSVFWNISLYDKEYFDSMFGDFVFPDFTSPTWDTVSQLQEFFLTWINLEREKSLLTFPVITSAMLVKNGSPVDVAFAKMCAKQQSEGNSFFVYMSENADSLASCCRLRNEISDNTFSYTLGAGGVSTGSMNVITLNINRLVQLGMDLSEQIKLMHMYQVAFGEIFNEYKHAGLLSAYDAGFISLDKQFLTIGINGMVEAAEFKGIEVGNNVMYKDFVSSLLKVIYDENKDAKKRYGFMFNTEFVPAENLGIKNAMWDSKDGLCVPRECYNSYFYVVEDDAILPLDKFILHGKEIIQYLDGGSALHLNLDDYLSEDNFYNLYVIAAKTGCNYFCTNVKVTICDDCGNIDKRSLPKCIECDSENVTYATRVIGYLKPISTWSSGRKKEHNKRHYHV